MLGEHGADLEPCPDMLARTEANRHKSIKSVLMAALSSRGHNVLMTIMTGVYQLLESESAAEQH
jgi:hypothetical protein